MLDPLRHIPSLRDERLPHIRGVPPPSDTEEDDTMEPNSSAGCHSPDCTRDEYHAGRKLMRTPTPSPPSSTSSTPSGASAESTPKGEPSKVMLDLRNKLSLKGEQNPDLRNKLNKAKLEEGCSMEENSEVPTSPDAMDVEDEVVLDDTAEEIQLLLHVKKTGPANIGKPYRRMKTRTSPAGVPTPAKAPSVEVVTKEDQNEVGIDLSSLRESLEDNISEGNLSDTSIEIVEYESNKDRAAEKILEQLSTSGTPADLYVSPAMEALLDDNPDDLDETNASVPSLVNSTAASEADLDSAVATRDENPNQDTVTQKEFTKDNHAFISCDHYSLISRQTTTTRSSKDSIQGSAPTSSQRLETIIGLILWKPIAINIYYNLFLFIIFNMYYSRALVHNESRYALNLNLE